MRCDLLEENLRWSRYAALKVRPGRAPGTGHRAGQAREQPGDDKGPEAWRLGLTGRPVVIIDSLDELTLPRKEVIQPHLPVRLPCYDFTPLTLHTFGASPLSVGPATSGADDSGGVTGGVYKARERIHRGMLIRDY